MSTDRLAVPVVTGPLARYEVGFRAHLARSGYAPGSARGLVKAMARASLWLQGKGLAAGGLTLLGAAQQQALLKRYLKFAACMRAYGLPNFPYPDVRYIKTL